MLIPAMPHTRPWAVVLISALVLWRVAHHRFNMPLPGRALRIALTLAAVGALWFSYGTLFGVVAGSALLIVMAGLKLIESRSQRDYFLLLIITLFIGLADFLYAPSALLAVYMLPALWLTLTAVVIVNDALQRISSRRAARISAILMLPALPIAVVLFFVFPRVHVPVWHLGGGTVATTGISDFMAPGSISQLAQSNRIAFRVHFNDPAVAATNRRRYWRGPVLHHFAYGTWRRGDTHHQSERTTLHGSPVSYTVTIQPTNHNWLYALDTPVHWPDKAMLSTDGTLYVKKPIRQRRRYNVVSYPQARSGLDLSYRSRERDLQLPADGNQQARGLAQHWHHKFATPGAIVKQALALFADGDFYYTLTPPVIKNNRNSIDTFLFKTQRGFCEHYASAFVFLMRAAGIPSRVVTGYAGGKRNPIDGNWTVRESRAHAWAEVWIAHRGWVRVDPTAAIPADHIDANAVTTAGSGARSPSHSWFNRWDDVWIATSTFWHRWVMAYGPTLQKSVFSRFGIDYGNWLSVATTMLAAIVAILVGLGTMQLLGWRSRITNNDPAARHYARFCRKLARLGIRRRPGEGPLDFSTRAQHACPNNAHVIDTITQHYIALRYTQSAPPDGLKQLAQSVSRLRIRGIPKTPVKK